MKNALVTGGCGFIGSNLVDYLVDKGYSVVVVDNLSTGSKEYCREDVKYYFGDVEEIMSDMFTIKESIDIIFHVGAISDTTLQDCNEMLYWNYTLSKKLFDLAG